MGCEPGSSRCTPAKVRKELKHPDSAANLWRAEFPILCIDFLQGMSESEIGSSVPL